MAASVLNTVARAGEGVVCSNPDPTCTIYVRAGATAPTGPCAGRTPETAYPTIRQGGAAVRNKGDNVCVEAGTYIEGDVTVGSGGTAGFPVVVRALGEVLMRPPGDASTDCLTIPTTGFLLLGRQHVTIEGFDLSGYCDAGIQVRSNPQETLNSSGITLRDNVVRGTRFGRGIDVAGEGPMEVSGNLVTDNRGSGISLQGCVRAPDVEPKCMPQTTDPIDGKIIGNEARGNGSHGLFVRGANDARVENNVVYENAGAGLQLNASAGTLIFNNLLFSNAADGIRVGASDRGTEGEPLPPAGSPSATIVNNTIYGHGEWGIEIGEPNAGSPGAVVLNNIVQNNGISTPDALPGEIGVLNESAAATPSTCGYVAGFNLVRNAGDGQNYGPSTPSNVYDLHADASFVDTSTVEGFRLTAGSPAIDAGYDDVDVVQISGSTRQNGAIDAGRADLGFHFGADANGSPRIDSTIMPIYVRASGRDSNRRPTTPATALASIRVAARDYARAGVEVVVGPGIYAEGQISTRTETPAGSFLFRADPSGRRTGDPPGTVRVSAECDDGPCDTGFLIQDSCRVRVEGFQVTGAREAGIFVGDRADDAVIAHNQVFDNLQRGIQVTNAKRVRIFDNLVYSNGEAGAGGGIQLGGRCPVSEPLCTTAGSPDAVVTFNTVFGNEVNGVFIGAGAGDSSGATFAYNISIENRSGNAIQVGNNVTREIHLVGFESGFNVVDSFSDFREVDMDFDYFWLGLGDPLFVDPEAGRFELDLDGIAAIDAAEDITAKAAGLDARSTRTDRAPDSGAADLGYHYPILDVQLAGDCDGNGVVTISELVTGVNIALGRRPLEECPAFDTNGDGRVGIEELVQAVNAALLVT